MSEKSLEIFQLCEKLASLLEDKEAIANVKLLYKRHKKDMYKNQKKWLI